MVERDRIGARCPAHPLYIAPCEPFGDWPGESAIVLANCRALLVQLCLGTEQAEKLGLERAHLGEQIGSEPVPTGYGELEL